MQSPLTFLYPPQCVSCGERVEGDFGLCGACWRKTAFIDGLVCDTCGVPLPGEDNGQKEFCDTCLTHKRPWKHGRAALLYKDNGRRLVLALKHGDRLDLARPAAVWMERAAALTLQPDALLVPVPAHWTRLFSRRYNQAAVLAQALARKTGLTCLPDALIRPRRTQPLQGMSVEARFAGLSGAIEPHPKRGAALAGRKVMLIDDVMTSGATLAVATEACRTAGADEVSVLVLARVAKDV